MTLMAAFILHPLVTAFIGQALRGPPGRRRLMVVATSVPAGRFPKAGNTINDKINRHEGNISISKLLFFEQGFKEIH